MNPFNGLFNPYAQLPYRRSMNQFGGNQIPQDSFGAPSIQPEEFQTDEETQGIDYNSYYRQPSPAMDKYNQHLMSMPTEEQNRPGTMDRITAALAGISAGWQRGAGAGIEASRNILDDNYNTAQRKWRDQGQGLGVAAQIEDKNAQRMIASMSARAKFLADQRKEKREDAKLKIDQGHLDISKGTQANQETPQERKERQIREEQNRIADDARHFGNTQREISLRSEADRATHEFNRKTDVNNPINQPETPSQIAQMDDLAIQRFTRDFPNQNYYIQDKRGQWIPKNAWGVDASKKDPKLGNKSANELIEIYRSNVRKQANPSGNYTFGSGANKQSSGPKEVESPTPPDDTSVIWISPNGNKFKAGPGGWYKFYTKGQ